MVDIDCRTGDYRDRSVYAHAVALSSTGAKWKQHRSGRGIAFEGVGVGSLGITATSTALTNYTNCTGLVWFIPGFDRAITTSFISHKEGAQTKLQWHYWNTYFRVTNDLTFGDITAPSLNSDTMYAFSLMSGAKPDHYRNGSYIGQGAGAITLTPQDRDICFGNYVYGNQPMRSGLQRVVYVSSKLSHAQIATIYEEVSREHAILRIPRVYSLPTPAETDPSCVLHLPLDKTAAMGDGRLPDLSGNGNHGTVGTGVVDVPGPAGRGVLVDGTRVVTVADAASLDITAAITVSAWVRRTATGAQVIATKGAAAYELGFTAGNAVQLSKKGTGSIVASSTTILDSSWHHVAATYDGTTGKIYIDGTDASGATTAQALAANATALTVGDGSAAAHDTADLRVLPKVLTPAEIRARYLASGARRIVHRSLERNVPVTLANVTSGEIPGTGIQRIGGTHRVIKTSDGESWLDNVAAGIATYGFSQSYGSASCYAQITTLGATGFDWTVMSSVATLASFNGYRVIVDAAGALKLQSVAAGTGTDRIASANGAIVVGTIYHIAWSRTAAGVWTLYLNGTSVGTATNNTYTTSVGAGFNHSTTGTRVSRVVHRQGPIAPSEY
jgi:hypothetical protein